MQIEVKITKSELEEIIRHQMVIPSGIKINVVLTDSDPASSDDTFEQDGFVWTKNRQTIDRRPDGLADDTEVCVIFYEGAQSHATAGSWNASWNVQSPIRHIVAYRIIK